MHGQSSAERFNSAYRLGLGIALAYVVLLMLVPRIAGYTNLVVSTTRRSAQRQKLSAANLESVLRQEKQFGPTLSCTANQPVEIGTSRVVLVETIPPCAAVTVRGVL